MMLATEPMWTDGGAGLTVIAVSLTGALSPTGRASITPHAASAEHAERMVDPLRDLPPAALRSPLLAARGILNRRAAVHGRTSMLARLNRLRHAVLSRRGHARGYRPRLMVVRTDVVALPRRREPPPVNRANGGVYRSSRV